MFLSIYKAIRNTVLVAGVRYGMKRNVRGCANNPQYYNFFLELLDELNIPSDKREMLINEMHERMNKF